MKLGTINQSLVLFLVMIFGFPITAKLSNDYGGFFIIAMSVFTVFIGLFVLIILLKNWEDRDKDNYSIAPFYFEVFIAYALFYAFAVVASPSGGFVSGLYDICNGCSNYNDVSLYHVLVEGVPRLILNSLYYSMVVMTTLGDSGITPHNILKMVVMSQVGFAFFLTVFGVADYFSRETNKKLSEIKDQVGERSQFDQTRNNGWCYKERSLIKRLKLAFKILLTGKLP